MAEPLDDILATINQRERLRVWSLIVTFFGDAIVPRGGAVSARTVSLVMERLGIGEGAVRTAFSRLAADGWVIREKVGRFSYYRLAREVAETFRAASTRIYAAHTNSVPSPQRWLVAIRDMDAPGAFSFDPGDDAAAVWLVPDPDDATIGEFGKRDCVTIAGALKNVPAWVRERAAPAHLAEGFRQLNLDFSPLRQNPPASPLDAIATRCLLIHEWRRQLLRLPNAPAALYPESWPWDVRLFVAELYHELLLPSERWLDAHASGPDGPLDAVEDVHKRFR